MAAVCVTVIPTVRSETPLVIPLHADHVHWGYFSKNETPIATIYSGQGACVKRVKAGQKYLLVRLSDLVAVKPACWHRYAHIHTLA